MKTHCSLLFLLLSLLFTFNLHAQTITGIVTLESDGAPLPGVSVMEKGTNKGTQTDFDGKFSITVSSPKATLIFSYIGCITQKIKLKGTTHLNVVMKEDSQALEEVVVTGMGISRQSKRLGSVVVPVENQAEISIADSPDYDVVVGDYFKDHRPNTEGYATIHENDFKDVMINPLSTFSVDVDRASYANVRRMINNGYLPNKDAVRIEEMVNYFKYDYEEPKDEHPFSINTELSSCPWNKGNMLLRIGLQGKKIQMDALPPSNIVFLIDVSGSMNSSNKLPLLKSSLRLLLETLRPQDKVAMVVYAGSSGLVLPSTSCTEKQTILNALEQLQAGGSTAGGAGLKLAYKVAEENFIEGGNNRIILATDGDFNVGPSSNAEMERLVESNRDKNIFISVLGYGMGNYKDDKAELIADKGNGNYAYIDNLLEAKKVLVSEFGGTLFTIAKDVKFQLEFNPAQVSGYRLIGYENRLLNEEDFDDDTKDAGEIGSGHTVTALYEIIPTTKSNDGKNLQYQKAILTEKALNSNDLVTLKLRYKQPDGEKSTLIVNAVKNEPIDLFDTSNDFRFAAAVSEFGMLLRKSEHLNGTTWEGAIQMATLAKGKDEEGYRGEMIRLMQSAQLMEESARESE